jgi:hypothetical protein
MFQLPLGTKDFIRVLRRTLGQLPWFPIPQAIYEKLKLIAAYSNGRGGSSVLLFRLDYLSCVLTVVSTILLGKRYWEGWILAAVNSAVFCVIGFRTAQFGFIPANVFCIALYAINLRSWRKPEVQ